MGRDWTDWNRFALADVMTRQAKRIFRVTAYAAANRWHEGCPVARTALATVRTR